MFITQPKIFISSTIVDLPNERKAALKAVELVGGFPLMSEVTMEAQSTDSLTACLEKVREADIYVLILGGRYGWQPEGKESITELEYQTAVASQSSILVFDTSYPKDTLQTQFKSKVESSYFRKATSDAFELQSELEKSLRIEIEKKQNQFFNSTEPVYSNLVKITFPQYVFRAKLDLDKQTIKKFRKASGKTNFKLSLHDYAVSALHMQGISFPHDWVLMDKSILTFHNLLDPNLPLCKIIDSDTAEQLASDEIYDSSEDNMSIFKFLLKKCLEAKLHKLKIKWIREETLFAFMPLQKDDKGQWMQRSVEWSKTTKKATRKVVDIKRNLKNKDEVFNIRCLSFRTRFERLDQDWFLSIKPEWIFLWPSLDVCSYAFKNIQWLKKTERNMHVFNHFNFILRYLQPAVSESLFAEYQDYRFLKIGHIEKFDFAPIVPDDTWVNLEPQGGKDKLIDKDGNVDLFGI